jgi:hypothetical protein
VPQPNVPQDMIAQIHQGEMIVPAGQAPAVRGMLGIGSGGGAFPSFSLPDVARVPNVGTPNLSSISALAASVGHSVGDTVNNGGDTHFNSSPTVHIRGSGNNVDALRGVLRDHTRELYQTALNWSGGGSRNLLPGRGI